MLKNIIILVVIIIGGYMVYTNYMQNEEIAVIDEDMNISENTDDSSYWLNSIFIFFKLF